QPVRPAHYRLHGSLPVPPAPSLRRRWSHARARRLRDPPIPDRDQAGRRRDRRPALADARRPAGRGRNPVPLARAHRRDAHESARGKGAGAGGDALVRPRRTSLNEKAGVEAAADPGNALQAELRALAERSVLRTVGSAIWTRRLVYGGAAVYALLFIATAAAHVESFRAGRADLGSMVQAVWSVSHGHLFESTTVTGREMSRLGIHVDPFLALLAPLWWLWSSPLMLLVVQAAAVSTGALPVYWLARKHLRSE